VATQSIRFDFLSSGAARLAADFRNTGDSASSAARGAGVLQKVIADLGQKENRTAAESVALAKALRLTGDAEDRAAAKALAADIAIRRLDDALKDSGKSAGGARGGFASLAGEVTGFGAASDAATSGGNKFKLALAGINLASGVLEPALAGAVVAVGGLAAGLAAAGAGIGVFGIVAKTVFSEASKAATAYATAQAKYASATTSAQRTAALKAEAAAYAGLSPPIKTLAVELGTAQSQWQKFTDAAAPGVVGVISGGLGLLPKILASMKPFLAPVEAALRGIIGQLNTGLSSTGFKSFIDLLAKNTGPAITKIAIAVGNVIKGVAGILSAFMPVSQGMLSGIDKITAKFAEWGKSLSGGTGFQSLMTTFKTETPQALKILTNLGAVIANVGKAMFGLSTFSNSRLLLGALLPLSGVLASLSKNTDLVRVAMYALLAVKIGQQFSWIAPAWQGLVKFAAAADGATIAETIAAAATRAWGLAMDALPWVALAAAVIAVAVLIIKYHQQIWVFAQKVWHDVLAVIMAVWTWVKVNWPLLLAIITGPIGLAILWVVTHFGEITTAVKTVLTAVKTAWDVAWAAITAAFRTVISAGIIAPFNTITGAVRTVLGAVSSAWNSTWNTLKAAFRVFVVDGILGPLGLIINGAAAAFGWIPGLGSKLKTAAAAFNTFRAGVNAALGGINGRTVTLTVAMLSGQGLGVQGPPPGVKKAAGGIITGGIPGRDSVLIRAMPGEVVVPTNMVRAGAVDHLRGKLPGFAAGGVVGVNVATHTPTPAQVQSTLMAPLMKLAVAFAKAAVAAAKAASGGVSGAGPTGGDAAVNLALAKKMFPWGASQWAPFNTLEMHEAGYNRFARNASSGAYGIPQAYPPTKMPFAAQAGGGSHAGPQLSWMFSYIAGRYGTPSAAWAQYFQHPGGEGSYDQGGWLMPGATLAVNNTGRPEAVITGAGLDGITAELRALRAELRQLTGVAAGIPAATGRHVGGAISGSAGAASFRNRYPVGGA
jgi:hypothetical protein